MKRFSILLVVLVVAMFLGACGASDSASESGPSEEGSAGGRAIGERTASESSGGAVGEEISASGGTFTRVSPEEMKEAVEAGDIVVVNTHVPFAGDIPGTDLSIPYNEIGQNTERLPGKDARIALYCLGGPMSDEASRTLVELGYTNVWDLGGGMEAWQGAGFPLEGA
jgi:rhodanese-related sulfurtransferase